MHPDAEQELAYILLIELFAYQFASPVRWIETQDVVLAEKRAERIIEVGPSNTLSNMFRHTIRSQYETHDAVQGIKRQILTYGSDMNDIYYNTGPLISPNSDNETIRSAELVSNAENKIAPRGVKTSEKDHFILHREQNVFEQQLEIMAAHLKIDLRAGEKQNIDARGQIRQLESRLRLWESEHSLSYAQNIKPLFQASKIRSFDSWWNWVLQDSLSLYYDIIRGNVSTISATKSRSILNRVNSRLLELLRWLIQSSGLRQGSNYSQAQHLMLQLIHLCDDETPCKPLYDALACMDEPVKLVTPAMSAQLSARNDINALAREQDAESGVYQFPLEPGNSLQAFVPMPLLDLRRPGQQLKQLLWESLLRAEQKFNGFLVSNTVSTEFGSKDEVMPSIYVRGSFLHRWKYSEHQSKSYSKFLRQAASSGVSYEGKEILIIEATPMSVGAEVVKGLLAGAAGVVVTTSSYSRESNMYWQRLYTEFGSRGSRLVVVPFNQASKNDIKKLVDYILDAERGLGWDLDGVMTFLTEPEPREDQDDSDSDSDLSPRVLSTNLKQLLNSIAKKKTQSTTGARPARVLLARPCNQATFHNSEVRMPSESSFEYLASGVRLKRWKGYINLFDVLYQGIDTDRSMRGLSSTSVESNTSTKNIPVQILAFKILGLFTHTFPVEAQAEPLLVDLSDSSLSTHRSAKAAAVLREIEQVKAAIEEERQIELSVMNGTKYPRVSVEGIVQPRAKLEPNFATRPDWDNDITPLNDDLKHMVDLNKVVVITGFAEIGPWGNSRTRWEMESSGELSLEGCVEMAWMMGLIKNFSGTIQGKPYSGWIDTATGEPVADFEVKRNYEKHILQHSGIRFIEPDTVGGYDPARKQLLHKIVLQTDLNPFESSEETAKEFKREHGEFVDIFEIPETGEYSIHLREGAELWVPKALRFDRLVSGQVPTGWNAATYGIPDDIVSQVDPVTLYLLVCTAEALVSSGITDPYELYEYVHVSQVGNCIGSGFGGATASRKMHKSRFLDQPVQSDILQEFFANTMAAWINMLLLSSAGPIKTPVGGAATAIESLETGCDTILQGKAQVCLVGGFDDFSEEVSYELVKSNATASTSDEQRNGRSAGEASRPATTTSNHIVESQGAGVQVVMTAKLALDMGLPIHGVVALANTTSDGIGRSTTESGQGLLTIARETSRNHDHPLLNLTYRRRQMEVRESSIREWRDDEIQLVSDEVRAKQEFGEPASTCDEYWKERVQYIEKEASRQKTEMLCALGNFFWKAESEIAPLRGALATWGLSVDDIGAVSFHGSGLKADDEREAKIVSTQMNHLGRTKGNPILGIFQKHLTGHARGAAASWLVNGALQVLDTGLVPGNRNADNINPTLANCDPIIYPNRNIQTDSIKAVSVTSFGHGQKGAQAIIIHPRYLFATLEEADYHDYCVRAQRRQMKARKYLQDGMAHNNLFRAKTHAPYTDGQLASILLQPDARVVKSERTLEREFSQKEIGGKE